MKGFYNSKKLDEIEAKDEEDNVLREKIRRQYFEEKE